MSQVTLRKISSALEQELDDLLEPFLPMLSLENRSVLIKPNLVEPEPWTTGQTTNPVLIEAIVLWCRRQGAGKIAIGEGPSYFQPASDLRACFTKTGIDDVARRQNIEWILFDDHPYRDFIRHSPRLPERFSISEHAFIWDHIINVPVPKPHYLTKVSIAMKNLKGFIKREHKPLFHHAGSQGIHGAITELNLLIRPSLNIVDGSAAAHHNKPFLLAGTDIVAVDAVAASLMGYNPQEVKTVQLGREAGLGQNDLTAIEIIGQDIQDLRMNVQQPLQFLEKEFPMVTLEASSACSGCLIPLFSAFRRLLDGHIRPTAPFTIIAGPHGYARSASLFIGRCARPSMPNQPWLRSCPPGKDELFEFLRSFLSQQRQSPDPVTT